LALLLCALVAWTLARQIVGPLRGFGAQGDGADGPK
jgi:hypothetical protein